MHPYPNHSQHVHRQTQCRAQVVGIGAAPQYEDKPTFGHSFRHLLMQRSSSEQCDQGAQCILRPNGAAPLALPSTRSLA